jgi:16S rRNA (uracil1498-N3)-methyltransferase
MELFYLPEIFTHQSEIFLSKEESQHIRKVLRKDVGEIISLTDGKGNLVKAQISGIKKHQIRIKIITIEQIPFPLANRIHVGLSVIRPNRLDWAFEKMTELGVQVISPLRCAYTSEKTVKTAHLKRVMLSAIKQSKQFYLPQLTETLSIQNWIRLAKDNNSLKFIAHQNENCFVKKFSLKSVESISLLVGPEGGFHQQEIKLAIDANFIFLNLGPNILRTETAAVVAVDRLKTLMI